MVTTIAEHSVDLDLLPKQATILDIGCLGFDFTREMRRYGVVCSVDIDELNNPEFIYFKLAISDFNGQCGLIKNSDAQATRIDKNGIGIECLTIKALSDKLDVKMWDLIKMDVEGSEYEIIMSLEKAPAKQLSIEFHLHTGVYKMHEVELMVDKLKSLGYEAVQHVYEARHCAGLNYWDSLWILK